MQKTSVIAVTTNRLAIIFKVDDNKQLQQIYLGEKLSSDFAYRDINPGFRNENSTLNTVYPTGGSTYLNEPAIAIKHADGNRSLVLNYQSHETYDVEEGIIQTDIKLKDPAYSFYVTLHYQAFQEEDVIQTWTTIWNGEEGVVELIRYASAFINIFWSHSYLTYFYGEYEKEMEINQISIPPGLFSIQSKLGTRTATNYNPSFFITPNQDVDENRGEVFGGTLAYSGNFNIQFELLRKNIDMGNSLKIIPGINTYPSSFELETGDSFDTPAFIFSYSVDGVGQMSRNFHHWAIQHGIWKGTQKRLTLLNNWESTYFDYDQDVIVRLLENAQNLGVELFLLDDGWFGNEYPRNDSSAGLGDWEANREKLPEGIGYLGSMASKRGIKFGIWIEPEMINPKSTLYRNHPDWVMTAPNRPEHLYRSQLLLDLINPKVQDFIFNTVNHIVQKVPDIAYIKWDCNRSLDNAYSPYLGANQNGLSIKYTKSWYSILNRIRERYPDLVMMLCASGGGRAEYGGLKYFQEFWPSDNTGAIDRLYMQWSYSYFYPALVIDAHVTPWSESTIKYKLDVAMSGKLGFDLNVDSLTDNQLKQSQITVANYRRLQEIINYGDLYRLISPYKTNFSSLMYVNPSKNRAVVFAYALETFDQDTWPQWKFKGLNPQKDYEVVELNILSDQGDQFLGSGKVFRGEMLICQGLRWYLKKSESSSVLELKAV